tara:strand:- start:26 stop:265 length:240 start_codon:yes stop_codon:yes gene_type:complete
METKKPVNAFWYFRNKRLKRAKKYTEINPKITAVKRPDFEKYNQLIKNNKTKQVTKIITQQGYSLKTANIIIKEAKSIE